MLKDPQMEGISAVWIPFRVTAIDDHPVLV
jgi:hypothetical protein